MGNTRTVLRSLLWSWILLCACVAALCAHTVIGFAQSAHLLGGDYALHPHGSLPIALAGTLCAGAAAAVLYLAGIVSAGRRSPPLLARALRRRAGWWLVPVVAVAACMLLCGMEFSEQAAAHRFDGMLSAFGENPLIGLASIAVTSAILAAAARALLAWIERAHDGIRRAAFSLLGRRRRALGTAGTRVRTASRVVTRETRSVAHMFGRAPPRTAFAAGA